MRQITAKHIEEKKARRNRIILGVFLIFIMFFSVVEYSFLSFNSNGESQIAENSTKTIYNGFEFSKQNGFWILNKDGSSFIFSYNPNEIVNYNFSAENIERYKNSALYLKTNDVSSESEIRANLGQFTERINLVEKENCEQNTIVVAEKNESKIYSDKKCVFIEGKKPDLAKLTDLFLFKTLGVVN